METYGTLYAFKCVFIHHSAQHQDNLKDARKYGLCEHKSGNSENSQSIQTLALPYFAASCPHHFLSETPPLQRKKQLAMTWANCWSSIFSSPSDRWHSDGPNRWSKRQPCARIVQHGRNGLPSLRLLPRLLGFIIGICIICKLKMFL